MLVRPGALNFDLLLGTFGLALLGACSLPDVMVDKGSSETSPSDGGAADRADRDAAAPDDAGKGAANNVRATAPIEAGAKVPNRSEEPMPDAGPDKKRDAGTMPKETDAGVARPSQLMDAATSPAASDDDAGPAQDVGNIFAAWPMPDAFPGSQTQPSYGTRANAVSDTITRLEWQQELPMIYPGCTGMHPDGMQGDCCTWVEAAAYCKSYGEALGQTGWRLPTKIELESIVDETKYAPAIDTFYFPATPNHAFWTSTLFPGLENNAYYVGFGTGYSSYTETTLKADVRCVR